MKDSFQISLPLLLIFGRCLPGIFSCGFSLQNHHWMAAGMLILAVWLDVATGFFMKKRKGDQNSFMKEVEGFVDFSSFIVAPALFVISFSMHPFLLSSLILFVFAGMFRISRFNLEGLIEGRYYRGLPVTYNGYLFPLAGMIFHYCSVLKSPWGWSFFLLTISWGMIAGKIKIPEL